MPYQRQTNKPKLIKDLFVFIHFHNQINKYTTHSFISYKLSFKQQQNKQMLGQTYFDEEQAPKPVLQTQKKSKKKANNKKSKKQKHQTIMKTLPPSCFSCTAHPDDYLRLIPEGATNRPTCKSCGFRLSGKLGYLICSKSTSCYVLCSACKVCTNNHVLRRMFGVKHLGEGNELYAKNMFNCHGCKKQQQVDQKRGLWHCNPCNFSICPDCIAKTEALWQEKNVSSDEEADEWEDV